MVTCSQCNYVFDETENAKSTDRKPCPQCGPTARSIMVSLSPATLSLSGSLANFVLISTASVQVPPFSFGAIVKVEKTVADGQIISFIDPIFTKLIDAIQKDLQLIYQLNPRMWEEIIAAAYDKAGFDEVILTPRSSDNGRGVIAIKKGFGSIKFIEQVKAYDPGHIVKADEVRALLGALQAEQDASKAIFTKTSTFAPILQEDKFIKPFLPTRLELVDKEKLLERLSR